MTNSKRNRVMTSEEYRKRVSERWLSEDATIVPLEKPKNEMTNEEFWELADKYAAKFGRGIPMGISPSTDEELRAMILNSIKTGVPLDDGEEIGY